MFKKYLLAGILCGVVLFVGNTTLAASSSFTANETVANVAVGAIDDQTATVVTSPSNSVGTKASTTITIASMPMGVLASTTIGSCVIVFSATDETDCGDNYATIATTTGGIGRTTVQTATALKSLINVHNATASSTDLTVSASSTSDSSVVFSTAATSVETGGKIYFSDRTGGKITNPFSLAGVAPVKQVDTITIGGTPETGDTYTISTGDLVGDVAFIYTVLSTDNNYQKIADGWYNTVMSSVSSTSERVHFVVSTTTDAIVLTARTAGTGFSPHTGADNGGISQVVTFTPSNVTAGETFTMSINSNSYSYLARSGDGVAQVVANLVAAAVADPVVSCYDNSSLITCYAIVAGTPLTSYSASVTAPAVVSSGGGGGGYFAPAVKPVVFDPVATTTLTKTLRYRNYSIEVKFLQEKLKTLGFIKKTQKTTTYFGVVTKAALIKFQVKNKIRPANGVLNVKTRALLNSL